MQLRSGYVDFKITLLQQPLVWRDGPANLAAFDALLAPIVGRDLIVLPEMFTTGFAMDAGESALPEQQVIDWLHAWAVKSHALIGGSVALKTDEGAVNRFLLVEPGGRMPMTNATCSAWPANITTKPATGVKFSNGAAGASCPRSATTCVSRSGRAISRITIWRCTSPTGRHLAAAIGKRCWRRGRLKTSVRGGLQPGGRRSQRPELQRRQLNHQPSGRDPRECGARRATRLDAELSLETLQSYRSAFPAGAMPTAFCV